MHLVKEYLVLLVVLNTLEKDVKTIGEADLVAKMVYTLDIRNLQDAIHADMLERRKQLKQHGIKIVEESRSARAGLQARYLCRGYERSIAILPPVIKAQVLKMIAGYKNIDLAAGGGAT